MSQFSITALEVVILLVYVIGVRVALGWWSARKARRAGTEEYFLGGRSLRWPIIGMSFYVANISGSSFIGLPSEGYANGVQVYAYEWLPVLFLIFFVWMMLPLYRNARVYTAPGFLESRYSSGAKLAFSGFLLFFNIVIDAAVALYAGGTLAKVLFPQLPMWYTIVALAVIAGIYIFVGGLRAVVLTDAIQTVLIYAGAITLAIVAFIAVPSWDAVTAANPEEKFHLIQSSDDEELPWPGMLTGAVIVQIYFWGMNQFIIQRAFGAKTLDHARRGALFAGLLKLPNLFILIIPGLLGTVLYPALDNPDLVFPTMVFDLLPAGVRVLMLAAVVAAILSSLEAILNSASTLFTMDFVRGFRPGISDRKLVWVGRIATLGFMGLAATWAPQIAHFQTLWSYLVSLLSYSVPPIVAVFLGGMFWRRTTSQAALTTLLIGVPLGLAGWISIQVLEVVDFSKLYGGAVLFGLSAAILVCVSLSTPAPSLAQVDGHVWKREYLHQDREEITPWYSDYRYWSAGLAILTAGIVIWWW